MKILPLESVEYLRPYACSYRSDCSKCPSFGKDCHFPNPYNATKEQLASVPYIAELWEDDAGNVVGTPDDGAVVITFDEIREEYERMRASSMTDGIRECFNEEWPDVYAYLRDCIDQGLHPCSILE